MKRDGWRSFGRGTRAACRVLCFVAWAAQAGVQNDLGIQVIPRPVKVEPAPGYFLLTAETVIRHDAASGDAARQLRAALEEAAHVRLAVDAAGGGAAGHIALRMDGTLSRTIPGAYRLSVTAEGVDLAGADPAGLFYGIQTLRQLLPIRRIVGLPDDLIEWRLPCATIEDAPRFPWRGLMLDCSRTFQSVDYLKATVDRMAFYKLNVLHLHLTDDQGWRLEIRRYPELTRKGARFPDRWAEPEVHQGFYTQAQMKDLVAYAAARHVKIVPEIELPGHALAALACYPELSCTGGPFEIHPFFKGPGIHKDIFCAGNDAAVDFIENVLAEVMEIFPSEVIHLGGDEAPKDRWKACPKCQARIKAEDLQDEAELQSWFIRRIGTFVQARGRRFIGWDEILEGGLAPGAAVMSWRGTRGGIAAAQAGHDVVMSPTSHCYFDYPHKRIDTRKAFEFEPVPAELNADQAARVLGLQANFWSHIDREPARVDRQLFPRLLGIAERGWSPAGARDWEDFAWRVRVHLARLDELGVSYDRSPLSSEPVDPVGSWTPAQMDVEYRPLSWEVTSQVDGPGRYRVLLRYTGGAHRLGIERVDLLCGGTVVATDAHRGEAGIRHVDNAYVLELKDAVPEMIYELCVSARSEGGTDSYGSIFMEKE